MLTSIATVSLSGTLEEKLQAVARAGFEGVEIFENDLLAFPGSAAEVGQIIRDLGMRCTLFQPFRDFEGLPEELRARIFDRVEKKFEIMQQLGTDLLLVCSSVSLASTSDRGRIVDDFGELGERAAAHGIRVGYEALAWGRHVWDHRQAWEIVKAVDHPAIGLILDSFHSLVRRIPMASLREIDPAKIFIVQIADAPWLNMEYLPWSRHFRNLPGQGDIPVKDFVTTLVEAGYRGPLSLEIFNDYFRSIPSWMVALDGIRSLRLTIDEASRAAGVDLPAALPPRVECHGVVFVEFAIGDNEAKPFAELLRSLGFALAGRHKSKAVERWQQGQVNIVVNSDPEGFAHSHYLVHGPSACAIALRINDVTAAVTRAEALSINSFEGRIGRGEMPVRAIRDVSGSLIYLVDESQEADMWRRDFEPVAAPEDQDTGLLEIDHLAYAMRDQELLSWLLHSFAFFDVEKKPVVEIFDPLGLVHSQPIESADRRLRLLLNGSVSDNTLTSRLHRRYWGAGLQYVSLRSSDIFHTAERLEELGLERLKIPSNYYEDIETRFGLAAKFVSKLARWDILYDQDGEGEYLQLNSRAFEKRFFFEIVERRGGYDQYGAANEVIKLTTQSRFKTDQENAL
ncbi:bifunctional sugar phosphate isomerase/epimerase/4-hydroxyphenylpyruvate dioxygenase family protein [Altererythrobacter sp. Root672]|uniref:bifunctional sugar phosphate isomerase/epimerase/4-hydroxyphenylpyruvate dioxygenase family protein n=1 Tax=Altererythrobacter sp. Root672 TaxID=1736584 RepID=UPI0006F4CEF2|nr:sugar phosphate isomerase/epimerase and 4-hydroxyphenylpyruvate domain-containing protein [Altererythrobacter sp. Root672]KRA84166.1 3-keto-5-aminohexanoate cleavage protein [Altererythrobacter sp. Root672]